MTPTTNPKARGSNPLGRAKSGAGFPAWTARQILEAFPEDSAPRYLLRDRDAVYGDSFRRRAEGMGIAEILTAARSPWQNPYAERMIGTIRRDPLDHVIVLSEEHLRRQLQRYLGTRRLCRKERARNRGNPESEARFPS